MGVIVNKFIKVTSSGRFSKSNGTAVIGPQIAFYKEKVSEIGYMLDKFPKIKIVELIDDGRNVQLNKTNYNKDNNVKSRPVSMDEPSPRNDGDNKPSNNPEGNKPEGADNKDVPGSVKIASHSVMPNGEIVTGGVNASPEAMRQYESMDTSGEATTENTNTNSEELTQNTDEEHPELENGAENGNVENHSADVQNNTQSQQNNNQQHSSKKDKKNKQKNNQQQAQVEKSTEVVPEEPSM